MRTSIGTSSTVAAVRPGPTPGVASWLKFGIGLALSVGLLWLAARQVDLAQLGQIVGQAHPAYLVAAVGVYFADLGLRAARWHVLLKPTGLVPVRRLYPVLAIGYMANNVLPGRVGELSRAYLVGRREKVSSSAVFASVAIERLLDGLTVLALLAVALLFLPLETLPNAAWLSLLTRAGGATFGVGLALFVALVVYRDRWVGVAARLVRVLPADVGSGLLRMLDRFLAGLGLLRDPGELVRTLVWSVLIWLVGAVTYVLVAAAFDVHLSLIAAVATIGVVNLATAVPQAPAGLGAFEAALTQMLVLLGVASTTAFGITIVLHLILFFPVVVAGLIFLWRSELPIGSLLAHDSSLPPSRHLAG